MERSSSGGGGFFCFSASSSSSSRSTAETSFHGQEGSYFYIRIPGLQILGYYLQFVPGDQAKPYRPLWRTASPARPRRRLFNEHSRPKLPAGPEPVSGGAIKATEVPAPPKLPAQ